LFFELQMCKKNARTERWLSGAPSSTAVEALPQTELLSNFPAEHYSIYGNLATLGLNIPP
jgi:hypothetical protein